MRDIRFGTDGIRGTAGTFPCTVEVGVAVGRAVARLARESGGDRVLVGRDPRPSGPMLEAAVCAGASAAGATVLLAGTLPTAGVATNLRAGLAHAGVMLTASHNPEQDNGFKVFGAGGVKLTDDAAATFEDWLKEPPADGEPGAFRDAAAECWLLYTESLGEAAPRHLSGRIAVDLANGAAVRHRDWLPERYPDVEWVFVGEGEGAVNAGCGSEHTELLAERIRSSGCRAGIAVDGDADRCVLLDENGEVVPGDALTWLLANGLGIDRLAVTVMSNGGLEQSLPGVTVYRTPVGDKHLAVCMRDHGVPLGAEESGHVLFSDGLMGGDGVLTGLRALGIIGEGAVSEAVSGFAALPRYKSKVRVGSRPPIGEVAALRDYITERTPTLGDGGRIFLRYSGTEPVLRILVEGDDAGVVRETGRTLEHLCAEELTT